MLAALAALTAGCAKEESPAKEKTMLDDEPSFSRIGPPDVAPVEFEGKRYVQINNGEDQKLDQRTGYLAVIDVASGKQVSAIKVYHVPFNPDMEADVQDVFMVRLELQADQRRLLVENEHAKTFYVSLDGYAVTAGP